MHERSPQGALVAPADTDALDTPASGVLPTAGVAWIGLHGPASVAGLPVQRFEDSDDFLLSAAPHGWGAYVVEGEQRGVAASDLIRLLRRRCDAPLLLLSAAPARDFVPGLKAGADMVLPLDVPRTHVAAALAAVQRRAGPYGALATRADVPWRLEAARGVLVAPDGSQVALTEADRVILAACAQAPDRRVSREELARRLWGEVHEGMDNALHATVYRLRKRIESGGRLLSPLQAVPRLGYEFRARLELL